MGVQVNKGIRDFKIGGKKTKKISVVLIAVGLALCHTSLLCAQQKVLLIVKDGSENMELMLTKEVAVMTWMLGQAGYVPVVATPGAFSRARRHC